MVSATSTAPGTSREERQQEQLRQNQEQAAIAERAANQPGGGVGQPDRQAPRGGPTWDPRWLEITKGSGLVYDDRGNVIYNPADLGAAEVERARAAAGEPPSSKVRGEPSQSYAASVYTQSKRSQSATRSSIEQLNTQKANAQAAIAEAKANIERAKAQRESILSSSTSSNALQQAANQDVLIRGQEAVINKYQNQISRIDSARTTLAKQEQSLNKDIALSAMSLGASRATSGPVDPSFSSSRSYQQTKAEPAKPQAPRVQAATGVQEKLFANPNYMQNAEDYTRPALFTDDVRRERPKALQGVTEKLFVNPAYTTREEQRGADKRSAFSLSLTENISRSSGPQTFAISLTEGAPAEPRKITQAEFDAMTPQQQAAYNAEISAYNQYVSNYNKQQKQQVKEARQQNVLQWKQAKSELLLDIANLKKQGVTAISALTTQGPRDIPINNAFKALSSGTVGGAKILGLGIAPNIPEGYTVTGLTNQTLAPTKETTQRLLREEQRKQIERDPTGLSKFIYKEEMAAEKGSPIYGPSKPELLTEVQRAGASYYATLASGVSSFFNLAKTGSVELAAKVGNKRTSLAYSLTPTLYQQKPTGFDIAFSSPIVAASESIKEGNATEFLPALQKEAALAVKTTLRAPIGAIVGQGAGVFALSGAPIPGKGLARFSPIKYTAVPLPTEKGVERVASVFTVGYNPKTSKYLGGVYGVEEKYKPFAGTPDFGRMGLERVTPPTGSSFDVYEFAAYNKQQSKPIYDLFRYGEKTGAVKPGTVEQQILENIERSKQVKMKVKYQSTLPVQIEGIPLRESEMQSMQQAVSVIQKKGYTEPGKGSLIQNMLSGWPKRAQGDLLDLEIKIPKGTEKIMKDVENLRYRAAEAAKKGDYEKQQKLLAKAEKRESKVYEKGEAAVNYILSNVKMEPGRALDRKGFNIIVGEADYTKPSFAALDLPKDKFYKSDVIIAHGTTRKNAIGIMEEGADPFQRPYGEPAFFGTTSKDILKTFASERVVLGKVPKADILYYKDIPKRERAMIRRTAKKEAAITGKPRWMTYQEAVSSYAKERGYKGATKPYHSTNPASPKFEYIIFEKDVFKPTQIVKPLGYELKEGTEKDVLNMIGPREMLTDDIAKALGNVDRPFGEKWPKGTTKFRVKDESGKVVTYKIGYQSMAKFKAISGIQSAESMADDFSHTQEWKDKLLGGARLVKTSKTYRYEKDPLDAYMLTYRNIKYQYEKGDIVGARESVQAALGMREYYTGYDFLKGAKTFKNISDIEVPQQPKRFISDTAKALSGRVGITTGKTISPGITTWQPDKPDPNRPIGEGFEAKYTILDEAYERTIGNTLRLTKRGDFPVGGIVKFGDEFAAPMYVWSTQPDRIFIGDLAVGSPRRTGKILSHETIHNVLTKIGEHKASTMFDVLEYGKLKNPVIKELALSVSDKKGNFDDNAIDVMLRTPSARTTEISGRQQKEKSPTTSPIQTKSISSTRSVFSARSGLVSARPSAMSPRISPRQSAMISGTSAKPSARASVRSPRFSTSSPKSISSPKASGFSPLSPSTKSPTSPRPYGSSPLSPSPRLTPSPIISPLYPIEPKPFKAITPPSPRLGFRPPRIKNTTDKTKFSRKDQLEFFGSTHAASVLGFRSKKKDFDYGKDLGSLAVKDIRTTDPLKKSPLTKKKSGMLLSNPKRYFTPTKKQNKNFLKIRF